MKRLAVRCPPLHRRLQGMRENWRLMKPRLLRGIDMNSAVFASFRMTAYNDNPRYISEALHALRPRTDIVWLFRDVDAARRKYDIPGYVRCVQCGTREAYEAAGRARVWVDNWRKSEYIRVGRRQIYVFSPHYDRGFKRAALVNPRFACRRVVESHAALGVIGSAVHRRFFREAYHYRGAFMMEGCPRNDLLLRDDPADEARIRERLGIDGETRILLYAPTYRDAAARAHRTDRVTLDLEHVVDVLEQSTGRRWMCLYRAHYLSLGLGLVGTSPKLADATGYPEMAELLRAADALITDYSSCAGDYALRGKPIWLFQDDIEEYRAESREMYIDVDATPFWKARTVEELDDLIRRTTPEAAAENCRAILDFYETRESGFAAQSVARYLCRKLGKS